MPSDTTIDTWISLSRAHRHILSKIEKSLKDASLPPLAWYDVLLELDRVGNKGIRPFELLEKLLLPQYSLSRLLDRLEQEGLLERMSCPQDGRGQRVVITRSGKAMRKSMWKIYGAALDQLIGKKLDAKDAEKLKRYLQCMT